MSFNNYKVKPYRNYDPHDVDGTFATDYTGLAGFLVKVSSNDIDNQTYYVQGEKVGANYTNVYNNRNVSPRKVTKATNFDESAKILGMTLQGTAESDNHGNKILGFNQRYADENDFAPSGVPVQIVNKGHFFLSVDSFTGGVPSYGSGLAAGPLGLFKLVDPKSTSGEFIVGKCLSTSGSRQGDVEIYLNV